MVRLRTNRWYGQGRQNAARGHFASAPNNGRRLISLCILLALVLVLIQRASDPRYIRNAFSALGVPLDAPAANVEVVRVLKSDLNELQNSPLQRTYRELLPLVFQDVSGTQLRALCKNWFANTVVGEQSPEVPLLHDASNTSDVLPEIAASVAEKQREITSTVPDAGSEWSAPLAKFIEDLNRWTANLNAEEPTDLRTGLTSEFVQTLTTYLDSYLIGTLRDASPWESSESLAFWRLLQRNHENSEGRGGEHDSQPPLISTLQLESQRAIYRGYTIRFQGAVRRAEWVDRSYPDLAMTGGYGILWLRGADQSEQPVAIYTTNELAKNFSLKQSDTSENTDFPEIELTGIVAKRLAYGSESGVQVAPTIFASKLVLLNPTTNQSEQPVEPSTFELGWIVAMALLIAGVGLIAMVLTKPKKRPKRSSVKISQRTVMLILCSSLFIHQADCGFAIQSENAKPNSVTSNMSAPPWAKDDASSKLAELMVKRLQEVLDPSGINRITAYISGEDQSKFPDAALKTIHALDQFGWTRALEFGKQLEFDSPLCSVRVANMSGMVRLAMPVLLTESQQAWFPYEKLYRLEVELDQRMQSSETTSREAAPQLVHVFCRTVPSSWQLSKQLRQPSILRGIAINPSLLPGQVEDSLTQTPFCVLVDTPSWTIPPTVDVSELQPEVKSHWLRLAQAGWDLSAVDLIAAHNQSRLSSDEQDAFYSFVRVASTLPWSQKDANTDTVKILGQPRESFGKPVSWLVRVVQASVVQVADRRAVQALGTDRYYQYDGFVDIGKQKIRYKVTLDSKTSSVPGTAPDSEVIEFQGEFPVTIVSTEPHLLTSDQLNSGRLSWDIGHYAQLDGEFYRLWSYHSELLESKGSSAKQIAPLIAANSLAFAASPANQATNPVGWFSAAIALIVLGILGVIAFYVAFPLVRPRTKV